MASTPSSAPSSTTHQPRILVLEDNAVLAEDLAQMFAAMGFAVAGPFSSVERAASLAHALIASQTPPDAACLDLNASDGLASTLARELAEAGVPTTLLTGQGTLARLSGVAGVAVLDKPASEAALRTHFAPVLAAWARQNA